VHGRAVRVEEIAPHVGEAGQVNLRYAIYGQRIEVALGVEAEIACGDVHVVDVEQESAVGFYR